MPEIQADSGDVRKAVAGFTQAVVDRDNALGTHARLVEVLGPWGQAQVERISTETGSPVATVRIDGLVDVTLRNAWSAVDADREGDLRGVFGEEFPNYFEREETVSLTPEAMKPSVQRQLAEAIGPDNFKKFFAVSRSLRPTATFHEDWLKSEMLRAHVEALTDERAGAAWPPGRPVGIRRRARSERYGLARPRRTA